MKISLAMVLKGKKPLSEGVKRSLTSLLFLAFTVWVVFFLPQIFFALIVSLFILLALSEFYAMVRDKVKSPFKEVGIGMGASLPLVAYFLFPKDYTQLLPLILFVIFLVLFLLGLRKIEPSTLIAMSLAFWGIIYIPVLFSYLIPLRFLKGGAFYVFFLFIVTKMGDVAAYGIGSRFGKRRISPRISPLKSWEGLGAGVLCSAIIAVLFHRWLPGISIPQAAIIGFLLGVGGQGGDLAESVLKRETGTGNSGGFLPGIGGFLDGIDSLLFNIPIFYYYLKFLFLE